MAWKQVLSYHLAIYIRIFVNILEDTVSMFL